jgi:hypothetical protein
MGTVSFLNAVQILTIAAFIIFPANRHIRSLMSISPVAIVLFL